MKRCYPALLVASLATALLAGCASAPAASAPAASVAAPRQPADARLLCREDHRAVTWASLGMPRFSEPVDLALTQDAVWVLVKPSILVRVPRSETAAPQPTFASSPDPEIEWTGVDVDPADGTLWLTKRHGYELVHLEPPGRALRVPLTRVTGDGGLAAVLAGPAALFTTPICADHALWIFDRFGEMIDPAFAAPEKLDDLDTTRTVNVGHACPRVHLARDPDGAVVAFDPVGVSLHRHAADGTWTVFGGPYDLEPPGRYTDPSGVRRETLTPEDAATYLPDLVTGLFFRDGEPVLLGSPVQPGRQIHDTWGPGGIGTVLYRESDGLLRPSFESCGGRVLLHVETDAHGFAALTREALLLGR